MLSKKLKFLQALSKHLRIFIQARIAQLVEYQLGTGEVPGSNSGKGENFSVKISNWIVGCKITTVYKDYTSDLQQMKALTDKFVHYFSTKITLTPFMKWLAEQHQTNWWNTNLPYNFIRPSIIIFQFQTG